MGQTKRFFRRLLLSVYYRKLWVQLAVILFLVVTIPVGLLGLLLTHTSFEAFNRQLLERHKEVVTRAAQEVSLYLNTSREVLASAALVLQIIPANARKQGNVLVDLALKYPFIIRAYTVDKEGKKIAGSDLTRENRPQIQQDILAAVSRDGFFISPVGLTAEYVPYLTIAVPINEKFNGSGALIAEVSLRGAWSTIDRIALDVTGRAFVVTDEGVLAAHQDKKKILRQEDLRGEADVSLALAGISGTMQLDDKEGKRCLSAYAPISGTKWAIVIRQDYSEAYRLFRKMRLQSWIIILISELASILVSIVLARRLVKPLKILASTTQRIASGDFNQKIDIRKSDEIGDLIRAFNDMADKLKESRLQNRLSAMGEITARITHEFKNSLSALKPFIRSLPRKSNDKRFIETFYSVGTEEIASWERMLKELADFSVSEELTLGQVDAGELIEKTIALMRRKLDEKRIEVFTHLPDKPVVIMADAQKLQQVLVNLILNAFFAMSAKGVLSISAAVFNLHSNLQPETLEIRVSDNGVGIPADKLDKIFEPFHTTNSQGMGLGLSISRKIIQQHGGDITVGSTLLTGSVFIIRLPLGQVETSQ